MASRKEPSFTTSFKCISALPFKRNTESVKALRLARMARRSASSVSKTVPKRNGKTVVLRKHSLTTRACSITACWFSSPGTYSLTMTASSPLGYANTWLPPTPLSASTGKGRRERTVPRNAFCSVMQYAYQAMTLLLTRRDQVSSAGNEQGNRNFKSLNGRRERHAFGGSKRVHSCRYPSTAAV